MARPTKAELPDQHLINMLAARGHGPSTIARMVGVSPQTVVNRLTAVSGDNKPWDDDRIALLKTLWANGLSALQIATRIGGTTRNAVIGKIHRLGLAGRANPYKNPGSRMVAKRPRTTPVSTKHIAAVRAAVKVRTMPEFPTEPLTEVADVVRVFSVADLEPHHCRWISGDPKQPGWGYCGDTQVPGQSYCAAHAARSYSAPMPVAERVQQRVRPRFYRVA